MSQDEKPADSDSVLLGRIDERVAKIDRCLSNHLRHHWTMTVAIVVAFFGLAGTFIARWYWGS